jgi:hypothetical protein
MKIPTLLSKIDKINEKLDALQHELSNQIVPILKVYGVTGNFQFDRVELPNMGKHMCTIHYTSYFHGSSNPEEIEIPYEILTHKNPLSQAIHFAEKAHREKMEKMIREFKTPRPIVCRCHSNI